MKLQSAISLLTLLSVPARGTPIPQNGASCGQATPGNAEAAKNGTAGGKAAFVLPDGRIKKDAKPEDFNVLASVFKSAVVKGDGLNFSDLILFPDVKPSIFDRATDTKAFEITISDKSIFVPKGGRPEANIRRADLLPSIRSTLNDVATTGVRTMHFSIQSDPKRKLNTTHDYVLMNLESKDFTFRQVSVVTGGENAGKLVIKGNSKEAEGAETLFSTDILDGKFQNFALKMDFNANTVQVFHSNGDEPLKSVTDAVANDLNGNGEYHFALQKNPVAESVQESGINEGIIFGGIFMEDSTDGKVSLQ